MFGKDLVPRLGVLGAATLLVAAPQVEPARGGNEQHAAVTGVPVAKAIETAGLRTVEGGPGKVQLENQITVVNFWASWCAPCKKELPELNQMSEAFEGRGVRFMAISIDEDPTKAKDFVASRDIDMPIYHDGPKGLARVLDLPHLPYTYVLDGKGDVVLQYGGAGKSELAQLRETLDRMSRARTVAETTGDN